MAKITQVRNFLKGKKTYLLGVIALLTASIAWADEGINNVEFATAVFVALQTLFIRAGISGNGEKKKSREGYTL